VNVPTNSPEFSVSELSTALKRTVEDAFSHVRVRGEISGYRGPHGSGHVYFSLKDANARIDAIIWKGVFGRLGMKPEDGMEVIATGKLSTFAGKSSYQIIIETMEPAGIGALLAQLEERKKRLAAEGLFDASRKRPLPYLPRVIGVVTSPTGAVIRDILHRLEDRFPCHVIVWPVRVQGDTSAEEVARAIDGFNLMPENGPIARPDLLIVARGGGSLEDLWSFNEEIVVRAAAASTIPLISAIGHETDTTLIDFASDKRAPTPTGAAEMAVPVRADLLSQVRSLSSRHGNAVLRVLEQSRNALKSVQRSLPNSEQLLASPRQKMDYLSLRLAPALRSGTHGKRLAFMSLANRLGHHSPVHHLARMRDRTQNASNRLQRAQQALLTAHTRHLTQTAARLQPRLIALPLHHHTERFENLAKRFEGVMKQRLSTLRERLGARTQLLEALSHQGVLKRGFALIADKDGNVLRSTTEVTKAGNIAITMADGIISATTTAPPDPQTPPRKQKPQPPSSQGSLF
jgi:exodeoxyribonuclease VII large subunit